MHYIYKTLIAGAIASLSLSSCLKEFEPTEFASEKQVQQGDKSSLNGGLASYMTSLSLYSSGGNQFDIGFPTFYVISDVMTSDFTVAKGGYDYFYAYGQQIYLGNYAYESLVWQRYYTLIYNANTLIKACADEKAEDLAYLGNALAYRAMAYFDLGRMYEYTSVGISSYDDAARAAGIYGLTVPIVTENTTESMGRNNPRVPYWHLYRFILNDLNRAEEFLKDVVVANPKTNASRAAVFGMKARLWLDIATRCRRFPENLAEIVAHDNDADLAELPKLAINNATDAYKLAAQYARRTIDCGFSPLTQSQWFDTSTGFNTPNQSWIWCVTYEQGSDASYGSWQSLMSFVSPEASWGLAVPYYGAIRCIDAAHIATIPESDWRRTTWIAPDDVADETAYNTKYAKGTSIPFNNPGTDSGYPGWKEFPAYSGFKFHPANGNRSDYTQGICVSYPLMRVEEMYLIEAEAAGYAQGFAAGADKLTSFVNGYRTTDGSYSCTAANTTDFDNEIMRQRRIELWGEGKVLWDHNRLGIPVVRGYIGTNTPEAYRFNTNEGYRVPWSVFYIPDSENARNSAVKLNPDMSQAVPKWSN